MRLAGLSRHPPPYPAAISPLRKKGLTHPCPVSSNSTACACAIRRATSWPWSRPRWRCRKGEFVAVVGPSGCGKSSLMKLVTGLLPPSEGNITVAGHAVTGPISIVGMAFQASTLLPWRTTLQQRHAAAGDRAAAPQPVAPAPDRSTRRRRASLLAEVGLSGFEDKYPGNSRAACSSAPTCAAR
ncbi:MAG: ATP-binding cassette domain-containing protein [Rhodovibrio sp.]|nr:ATP-binding cassette domain-containing protein [Rhodovibrio sp.]